MILDQAIYRRRFYFPMQWEMFIENVACGSLLGQWGYIQKQKHNHHTLSYFYKGVFETSPWDCLTYSFGDLFPTTSIVRVMLANERFGSLFIGSYIVDQLHH